MNKETKIAKQNIEVLRSFEVQGGDGDKDVCIEHKQTCQRWLEFLEKEFQLKGNNKRIISRKAIEGFMGNINRYNRIMNKYTDLKQAIKLYDEARI